MVKCGEYSVTVRWPYLITTASGGTLHYDPAPTVLYRQHGYELWFNQMVAAIGPAADTPLVVVEYDRLLSNPEVEIRRLAIALGLPVDPKSLVS